MPLSNTDTAALIDKIYLLLQVERTLLEAGEPDWDRLEENLGVIGELFKLLSLNRDEPAAAKKVQLEAGLHRQLEEVIIMRRDNLKILQKRTRELGRRVAALRLEKTALLAYTGGEDSTLFIKKKV